MEDPEWSQEELPEVFALMGPRALPLLGSVLADPTRNVWTRATAIEGIKQITIQWPEQHAAAVALLIEQMERMEKLPPFAENDDELNAFMITSLVQLKAQEALPVIERAFKANHVDEMITGPWEAIQYDFGLITKEEFDQLYPPSPLLPLFGSSTPGRDSSSIASLFDPLPPGESKHKRSTKSKKPNKKWLRNPESRIASARL